MLSSRKLTVISLVMFSAVIVAVTTLKAFFVIGLLWRPEAQRVRSISLIPLKELLEPSSWFSLIFGYGGNLALFVPFGVLLYALLRDKPRPILRVTLCGFLFSLCIEICQFIFALGKSDIDDIIFNTLGACLGAFIARAFGPKFTRFWAWLGIVVSLVFVVLVILGPRLGDQDKVVELNNAPLSGFSLVSTV